MNFAANMSARVYYSQGGLFNRTVNPGRDLTPPSGGAGGAVHTHISRQHAIKRATVATSRCCGSSLALGWSVLVIFFKKWKERDDRKTVFMFKVLDWCDNGRIQGPSSKLNVENGLDRIRYYSKCERYCSTKEHLLDLLSAASPACVRTPPVHMEEGKHFI